MKKFIGLLILLLLITGCSSGPEIVDTGDPGKIKVIVYLDENRDGVQNEGEPGLVERVFIAPDNSCPADDMGKVTEKQTNSSGEALYLNLEPGVYCVMYIGSRPSTTKLTVEVPLSSDQEAKVAFGVTE
jgi:hypothetical protein